MQNRFFEDSIGGNIIPSILSADTPFSFLGSVIYLYLDILRKALPMRSGRLYTFLKTSMGFVIPATLAILIIIFGGIGVYLAEHNKPGANITNLGNAFGGL